MSSIIECFLATIDNGTVVSITPAQTKMSFHLQAYPVFILNWHSRRKTHCKTNPEDTLAPGLVILHSLPDLRNP